MDSKSVFLAAVKDLDLEVLLTQFQSEGWDTYANFAFCTPDFQGKDPNAFELVMKDLLKTDDTQKHLKSRLRRLYAQAYYATSTAMASAAEEKDPGTKIVMHSADRVQRTEALRKRIQGFKLEHHNMPGSSLVDKLNTILVKGAVRYVAWNVCISRAQEIRDEPEIKGLRISPDGLLL